MIRILHNLNEVLTLAGAVKKDGRFLFPEDLSIIPQASVVYDDTQILWVGKSQDLPAQFKDNLKLDLSGHCLTPGLIDSHTHLIFAGDRAHEYVQRLNGKSYQQIASAGGGIHYTVEETQRSSEEDLFHLAQIRLEKAISLGIRQIEIKTGYGLLMDQELKLLHIAQKLKHFFQDRIDLTITFMGAHAIPKSMTSQFFVEHHVLPVILKNHDLFDMVDVFYEVGYFSREDVLQIAKACQKVNKPCKLHADEFGDSGGAALAVEINAASADHLLGISDAGIKKLSSSQTVATILPGTALFLGKKLAPARKMLDAGVSVALASDYNPGSCHYSDLLKIASISAPSLQMNQAELWASMTYNAAKALRLKNCGGIIPGYRPLFTLYQAPSINHITYNWGENLVRVMDFVR